MSHSVHGEALHKHQPNNQHQHSSSLTMPVFRKADRRGFCSDSAFQAVMKKERSSSWASNSAVVSSPTMVSTLHSDSDPGVGRATKNDRSKATGGCEPHPIPDHLPSDQNCSMDKIFKLSPSVPKNEYDLRNDHPYFEAENMVLQHDDMTLIDYSMYLMSSTCHASLPMIPFLKQEDHFTIGFKPIANDALLDETTITAHHSYHADSWERTTTATSTFVQASPRMTSNQCRIKSPLPSFHEPPTSPPKLKRITRIEEVAIPPSEKVALEKKLSFEFILGEDESF